MNGGTTDSSTKKALKEHLYGGSSIIRTGNTTSRDTVCSSGDYSPKRSFTLCRDDSMLVPSMIPLSHSRNNLVSMAHIFPSFRTGQNKVSSSVPGSSHTCRVCAKTFRASSLLDIHMRVHVGAKPFVCPICGHRATQKGNLKLHMKKHHGAELPPHIDLVPDSGIWGHPQENVLCSNTPPQSEGFDDNLDASGKRKQVAQAVSSLLNEEVVELIKKYQNDVGQGTTGTITESLEDFIRIAKNKSGACSKDASTVYGKPKKGKDDYRKKRLALSLRFQPYPECITSKKSTPNPAPNVTKCSSNCTICGKSCGNLSNKGSRVCQECLIVQQYTNPLTDLASKEIPTLKKEVLATINNVLSEELTQKSIPGRLSTCDICGLVFLSSNLETHKEVYHSSKRNHKRTSNKEHFLQNLGLVAKENAASMDKNISRSLSHEEGLNPALGHIMAQCIFDARKDVLERCQSAPSETKADKSPTEREVNTPSPIRRRASPGVLKMLRQTLLNSADQKESNRQNMLLKSDDISPCFSKDGELQGSQTKETYHYRNPAMQSLAEIGKSVIFSDILSNSDIFQNKHVSDNVKSSTLERQDHEVGNGYKCPYCPKWFKYRSVLEIHVRSHTGERPYKCPFCEYAGTQHNCLKLHIQRHHPTKNPYNPGTSIISQNMGVSSRPSIPDPSPTKGSCFSPVNCPVCGRVSPSPGYLKIHMRSHKKSLDHVCHVCGRGFKEYWYLSTHLKTHERELNSLKFNLQQYNAHRSQSKPSSNANHFGSQLLLNKFAATFAVGNDLPLETGLKPRIIKHEPTSTRHIYAGAEGSQSGFQSESERNSSTPVSQNDGKSNLNDHSNDKGVVGSRSRRRKASCPSRVVSSPYVIPRSPIRRSTQSPQKSSETLSREDNVTQNATNSTIFNDESPLDLRCPAKKMNDTTDTDVPMNLCKM